MNALIIAILLLAVTGATLIVTGIATLAGIAWASIALGFAMVVVAALLRRGLTPNG